MTNLERFNKIVNFEKPDRPMKWFTLGFWQETRKKWEDENGVPPDVDLFAYLGLEEFCFVPGNTGITSIPYTPAFEIEVLQEDDDKVTFRGKDGIVSTQSKKGASMPHWIEFPVKTANDWEKVKERINPDQHDYGTDYDQEIIKYHDNDEPNGLVFCGLYAFHRNLMGMENLAYAYYDLPEVLKDMAERWLEFYTVIGEKIINDMRVDYIGFHEDMCYKTGPLIGVDQFNEFMTPYYKELIANFKKAGVRNYLVDTDGNVDIVLPLYTDLGINIMVPFEQRADNDIFRIREQYPDLVIWGGIDKMVLNQTKDDIRKEVYEKLPEMWEKGGYIPCLDHSTQPCPLENFKYYVELITDFFKP